MMHDQEDTFRERSGTEADRLEESGRMQKDGRSCEREACSVIGLAKNLS